MKRSERANGSRLGVLLGDIRVLALNCLACIVRALLYTSVSRVILGAAHLVPFFRFTVRHAFNYMIIIKQTNLRAPGP
jgi:hypothetical protein